MNDMRQHHWLLLGRPRWAVALALLACFGSLFYTAGASWTSPAQLLIVALGTIAFIALFDVFRYLFRSPAISRLPAVTFCLGGLLLVVLFSLGLEWACRALAFSTVLKNVITFSFIASASGAIGGRLVEPSRETKEGTSRRAP